MQKQGPRKPSAGLAPFMRPNGHAFSTFGGRYRQAKRALRLEFFKRPATYLPTLDSIPSYRENRYATSLPHRVHELLCVFGCMDGGDDRSPPSRAGDGAV